MSLVTPRKGYKSVPWLFGKEIEIPEEWEVQKIEEIVKDEKFSIVDGPFGTQLHSSDYVEEGIPLIRVANTGISGIYDAYGRMTVQLNLGETGTADGHLPQSINNRTIHSRFGDLFYMLLFLLWILLLVYFPILFAMD